jgi:hypothetical protein
MGADYAAIMGAGCSRTQSFSHSSPSQGSVSAEVSYFNWTQDESIKMTPEEESSNVRVMIWEMSRMTNRILIIGLVLILSILAVLMYLGIIAFPSLAKLGAL